MSVWLVTTGKVDVLRHGGDDEVEVHDVASKGCPGDGEQQRRLLRRNLRYPVGKMQIVVTLDDDGVVVVHRLIIHPEVVVLHLEVLKVTYYDLMMPVRKSGIWL